MRMQGREILSAIPVMLRFILEMEGLYMHQIHVRAFAMEVRHIVRLYR